MYLAVRDSLKRHPAIKGAWTLLAEVGGGSTNITLLRHGQPIRSGVYALALLSACVSSSTCAGTVRNSRSPCSSA